MPRKQLPFDDDESVEDFPIDPDELESLELEFPELDYLDELDDLIEFGDSDEDTYPGH